MTNWWWWWCIKTALNLENAKTWSKSHKLQICLSPLASAVKHWQVWWSIFFYCLNYRNISLSWPVIANTRQLDRSWGKSWTVDDNASDIRNYWDRSWHLPGPCYVVGDWRMEWRSDQATGGYHSAALPLLSPPSFTWLLGLSSVWPHSPPPGQL